MAWSKAVEAIANSVSEISKTVAAYGPDDEGKAVRAAKKAGNKAKSLVSKSYPKCETAREFSKKIQPLIDNGLLDDSVVDRATYNYQRSQVLEQSYTEAYEEVMSLYRLRLQNQANGVQPETAEDCLVDSVLYPDSVSGSTEVKKTVTSGCLGAAVILLLSSASLFLLILNIL